jgi:predicted acyl esterase
MRDGVSLATDIYLPPVQSGPVIVMRSPYGRNVDGGGLVGSFVAFARRGYIVVAQDCRGTGESEPDSWDYYVYESEDGIDLVDWIVAQPWYGGFIASCGASYTGQTQWCMAVHSRMSTIVPSVSGLGVAFNSAHLYMFLNAYARVIGKGGEKVSVPVTEMERAFEAETMAGGYFNEPLHTDIPEAVRARFPQLATLSKADRERWLWERYCQMTCAERAELIKAALGVSSVTSVDIESLPSLFGHRISHDALTVPHVSSRDLCGLFHAPPFVHTAWYDWALNDALATWQLLRSAARPDVARRARLLITPHAHHMPGYREGSETHPELLRFPSMLNLSGLLLSWYAAVREDRVASWPTVIYYLMGANEWRVASDWPVPEATTRCFYLGSEATLTEFAPDGTAALDSYIYDPRVPTPTVGGSIVSFLYPPGSVDVGEVQRRSDVLVYSTAPLERDLDVVGPVRMRLYASSSAVDTDFVVRLSDVFPDGRALQLQSGILRARYRDPTGEPELLEPGTIYALDVDMWATANRFKAGHRIRVDISSADFPRFDRNSNRAGQGSEPVPARQCIYHDREHPSQLIISTLG